MAVQTNASPRRVLFLSTRNAARSLMAEAWLRALGGEQFVAESAGTDPSAVADPLAVQVMREAGLELARPRSASSLNGEDYDLVIALCPREGEVPVVRGAREVATWSFDEPSSSAANESEAERLKRFCRLREELRTRVSLFVNATTDSVHVPSAGTGASTQQPTEHSVAV